jgi:hypothetical protein
MVQKVHITQSYMMRRTFVSGTVAITVYESHHIVVMRLVQTGVWHGTGGLKVSVSSGNLWPFSPTRTRTCAHTSEALVERYINGNQLILGN